MPFKKIGDYLIEQKNCDAQMLSAAMEQQTLLRDKGVYKPIGQIIIEKGNLTPEDLKSSLHNQVADMLGSIELFKSLPPKLISKIASIAKCVAFPEGEIIIHEGDQGDSFYQVIAGLIRVFHVSEDGVEVTLNTLGPGEGFGEMALLTGEPRSASVDIQQPSSLLIISKQAFDQLVSEIPEFSLMLSEILSRRLRMETSNFVKASSTQKAYQRFIIEQNSKFEANLIGRSKTIRKLQDKINKIAQNDGMVLIQGEPGTEKIDVARLIHSNSSRENAPFLSVDAKSVNMGRAVKKNESGDEIRQELAQASTLFGHIKAAFPSAPERRLGLFQVGDEGVVVIKNIEHLSANIQIRLVGFLESKSFQPLGSQNFIHSSIRVMATTCVDLEEQVKTNGFNKELFDFLKHSQTLMVPPLRKRKRDIRLLIKHLLKVYGEKNSKPVDDIEDDVYKNIMAYDWPGNTDELKAVIKRAVNLTSKTILSSEDILIGMAPQLIKGFKFNLLKVDQIGQLFSSKAFPKVFQFITACFFALILFFGFFGSQKPGTNISLGLTWGLWEPLAIFSCILAARIWCAVCPVGAVSSYLSYNYGLKRNIPQFIRSYGGYFALAALFLIFFSEALFAMPFSPRATAIMILSIVLPAVILALIYKRRMWCRFLCPLGKLLGFFSRCSIMELRANCNICNNDCEDLSCYVDSDSNTGCPVFEAPFVLSNNQECILCGNCIKNCPHQSPVLNLRAPGQELWSFQKPDSMMILLSSLIMGSQFFRGMEKTSYFHSHIETFNQQFNFAPWSLYLLFISVTGLLSFLLIKTAGNMAFNSIKKTTLQEKSNLMSYGFVPIIAGFEMGFHFERLINWGGSLLPQFGSYLGFNWDFLVVSMGPGLVKVHQTGFILIALLLSQTILVQMLRNRYALPIKSLALEQKIQ
ncbi:MAG: cyclic nucleotide-binding domain-containing protein [Desulfobacula sp.]|nr:cyclic nucleotide-binding domain-containing protein [Desulfobacula sp.]